MEPLSSGLVTDVKCKARLEGSDAMRLNSTMVGGRGGPYGFKNKDGHGLLNPTVFPAETRTPNPSRIFDG